jgi:hypothetical protein
MLEYCQISNFGGHLYLFIFITQSFRTNMYQNEHNDLQFYLLKCLTQTKLEKKMLKVILNFFLDRAPADCRQYFTGVSGTFKSYNFAGGAFLSAQQYTNCFRQELGETIENK